MYPDSSGAALAELVAAAGVDAAVGRAEEALARGDAVVAIRVAEAVESHVPDDPRARDVLVAAHRHLLDHGGDVSFWENGWLRHELERREAD
jgi:hypothetical protein